MELRLVTPGGASDTAPDTAAPRGEAPAPAAPDTAPGGALFTLKSAAAACGVDPQTIRRRRDVLLAHGATRSATGWTIPLGALLAAGLHPGRPAAPDRPHLGAPPDHDDVIPGRDSAPPGVAHPVMAARLAELERRLAEVDADRRVEVERRVAAEQLLAAERRIAAALADALALAKRQLMPGVDDPPVPDEPSTSATRPSTTVDTPAIAEQLLDPVDPPKRGRWRRLLGVR